MTAAEYFAQSQQEKARADKCQAHTPWRLIHLANAQLYATWARYEQHREQTEKGDARV